jgi:hypothetical protein
MMRLTPQLAGRLADAALGHVRREYPYAPAHVMTGEDDWASPRVLHPLFFGSFDWHSNVHGWWTLARIARLFPALPQTPRIVAAFDAAFTADAVAGELAYLNRASARGFERPYGWAWLLTLAAELARHAPYDGVLRPLAQAIAERFKAFLPLADYPNRAGTHASSAFALALAIDYGDAHDPDLAARAREKLLAWHSGDADAQAWEPSQEDFLSPTLMEAAAMGRALEPAAFQAWFAGFLPRLRQGEPAALLVPAHVSDRSDGRIAHLDGLNLSCAWCWRQIAGRLDDPALCALARAAAEARLAASLPHVTGDYMGEHWLASFALLALEA